MCRSEKYASSLIKQYGSEKIVVVRLRPFLNSAHVAQFCCKIDSDGARSRKSLIGDSMGYFPEDDAEVNISFVTDAAPAIAFGFCSLPCSTYMCDCCVPCGIEDLDLHR